MVKLIIFDFDGVIIDSHQAYFASYNHALKELGVTLSQEEIKRRIIQDWGKGYSLQLKSLLIEQPELLPKAIEIYLEYRQSSKFKSQIRLFPGVKETLEKLKRNYILAVATGISKKYLKEYLDRFDLHVFERLFTIDDISEEKNYKPSPYMLLELMQFFSVSKKETVYVGDAGNDVSMAISAEVEPIVVLTGHLSKSEAEQLGVEKIIPDATHVEEVLN